MIHTRSDSNEIGLLSVNIAGVSESRYYTVHMSTGKTWQIGSTSSAVTEQLAEQIGHKLKGGEVIELISDLGGGKTTFVRGLARGTSSTDKVASPTFTISKVYKAKDLTLYHFDFYRLHEPGVVKHELAEVLDEPQTAVVIEWADIVQDALPAERLTIHIKSTGDETREFTFIYPESLEYLLEGIQ